MWCEKVPKYGKVEEVENTTHRPILYSRRQNPRYNEIEKQSRYNGNETTLGVAYRPKLLHQWYLQTYNWVKGVRRWNT